MYNYICFNRYTNLLLPNVVKKDLFCNYLTNRKCTFLVAKDLQVLFEYVVNLVFYLILISQLVSILAVATMHLYINVLLNKLFTCLRFKHNKISYIKCCRYVKMFEYKCGIKTCHFIDEYLKRRKLPTLENYVTHTSFIT